MSVDKWARREAEVCIPAGRDREFVGDGVPHAERIRFADGITHAFSALLSDEAMEAAARNYWALPNWERLTEFDRARQVVFMRAALQAAIDAVTKEARND